MTLSVASTSRGFLILLHSDFGGSAPEPGLTQTNPNVIRSPSKLQTEPLGLS